MWIFVDILQELLTKILFSFILKDSVLNNNQACKETRLKTLVLGVGNPIRGDAGAGFRVAQLLKGQFYEQQVTVLETSENWLDILDLLPEYDKVIIVTGIQTPEGNAVNSLVGKKPAGSVAGIDKEWAK